MDISSKWSDGAPEDDETENVRAARPFARKAPRRLVILVHGVVLVDGAFLKIKYAAIRLVFSKVRINYSYQSYQFHCCDVARVD